MQEFCEFFGAICSFTNVWCLNLSSHIPSLPTHLTNLSHGLSNPHHSGHSHTGSILRPRPSKHFALCAFLLFVQVPLVCIFLLECINLFCSLFFPDVLYIWCKEPIILLFMYNGNEGQFYSSLLYSIPVVMQLKTAEFKMIWLLSV